MGHRPMRMYRGTCGIYPFHRQRVTPDYFGINGLCLEDFDPAGLPVRATVGAGMA